MSTIGDLVVGLGLDRRGFSGGIGAAQRDLDRLVGSMVAVAGAGLGAFALKLAADAEQTQIALKTMLGSAELARQVFAELEQFAASTPFQSADINAAAQKLLAFNTSADELLPTLKSVGDIAAGIGAPLGEIAEIYGKARVQGRLFNEDINQLTGRGIPIIQELAKQFGVAESQVKQLVANGSVNFTHLEKAFKSLTSEGGKFSGLMEAQSKSLGGAWSTLMDNLKLILKDIGQAIIDAFDLKGATNNATGLAQAFRAEVLPVLRNMLDLLGMVVRGFFDLVTAFRSVVTIVVTVVAAMMTITVAQKAIAIGQTIVQGLMGPAGWAAIAAGLAVAAASSIAVSKQFDKLQDKSGKAKEKVEGLNKTLKQTPAAASAARESLAGLNSVFDALEEVHPARKLKRELEEIDRWLAQNRGNVGRVGFRKELREHRIDKATGVFSGIRDVRNEMAILRGETTETEIALQEMLSKGAPPEVVESLRQLQKERDKLKAQKDAQKKQEEQRRNELRRGNSLRDSVRTPLEKFRAAVLDAQKLARKGAISRTTLERVIARERNSLLKERTKNVPKEKKSKQNDPRFAARLDVRSAEGFAALAKAFNSKPKEKDPTAENTKVIAETNVKIKEILEANNELIARQEQNEIGSFN